MTFDNALNNYAPQSQNNSAGGTDKTVVVYHASSQIVESPMWMVHLDMECLFRI